jgi:peptide-methionine (S)-S-oxide reductase
VQTSVGYTQGTTKDPTYREVCSGRTGHVEAVQVEFDPAHVSYRQLLDVFWKKHDPTQKNRQVRQTLTPPLRLPPILQILYNLS